MPFQKKHTNLWDKKQQDTLSKIYVLWVFLSPRSEQRLGLMHIKLERDINVNIRSPPKCVGVGEKESVVGMIDLQMAKPVVRSLQ